MKHASTFTPYRPAPTSAQRMAKSTKGASDFLRSNTTMAALLPALSRMAALQKAVAAGLPAMFVACEILNFETGALVMSAPNAALAARLKQQLPKLQDRLQKDGWQVNSIRIKVQVGKIAPPPEPKRIVELTDNALSSFAELSSSLSAHPRSQGLKDAIDAMIRRRQGGS
ncbi:DciA family protein [Herbaspirillum sp. WKF16]|uniref:DciA family protein n=1 Tax=Herbaspirillum sp. WKF16 TaxID=3028312 RepID=UPI0023A9F6F4|nr:DciA family protein [Herbaspirillum sp. WKF16]WDZ96482.1 DciA family protein [Herbaspirillum sp. WKF16]